MKKLNKKMLKLTLTTQQKRFIFWSFVIFVSYKLLAPVKHSGIDIPHLDKVAHITIFALLTYLAAISYQLLAKRQLIIWGSYGLIIEILQGLTTVRTADVFDFIANMIGVLIALAYLKRTASE